MILADLAFHANAPSLIWCGIAAVGVGFSATTLPQYVAKLATAHAIEDADDRKVALDLVHDYILSESFRAAQHLPAFAIGVWSLFVPSVARCAPVPRGVAIFAATAIWVLYWNSALATANSIRAYLAWRRRYGVVAAGQRQGVRRRRR
jgi:hypothetical protein